MLLRHLTMRWMVYGYTCAIRSDINPPDQRDRAMALNGVKPIKGLAMCLMT